MKIYIIWFKDPNEGQLYIVGAYKSKKKAIFYARAYLAKEADMSIDNLIAVNNMWRTSTGMYTQVLGTTLRE